MSCDISQVDHYEGTAGVLIWGDLVKGDQCVDIAGVD